MKRFTLLFLALTMYAGSLPAAQHASNLKRVARQGTFPLRHPTATIKGIFYEAVTYVGAAIDVAERGAAAVHAGVSKVDEAIDKIEDQVKPAAAIELEGAAPAARFSTIPGCDAKAFIPKDCYAQMFTDHVEVRCGPQTFTFRCMARP